MTKVRVLEIKERYQLSNSGVVLVPDLPIPELGWETCSIKVGLEAPNGEKLLASAQFTLTRFKPAQVKDPLPGNWRVVIIFPEMTKEELPVESYLWVPESVAYIFQTTL